MPSMAQSMVRNLKQFVEHDLVGVVRWDEVRVALTDDAEAAEGYFKLGDRMVCLRVESPDLEPNEHPLGYVYFNNWGYGPIDTVTWDTIAKRIRLIKERHGTGQQTKVE